MGERAITFTLNAKELKRLEAFKKRQKKLFVEDQLVPVTYTYHFTPTGVGTVIKVENNTTKVDADITDYDSW